MAIRRIDDIERDKAKESRDRVKREISEDVNEVLDNVFRRKKRKSIFSTLFFGLLKFLGVVILLMLVLNFFLGNIWLLKFFLKSLFGLG